MHENVNFKWIEDLYIRKKKPWTIQNKAVFWRVQIIWSTIELSMEFPQENKK